MDSCENQSYFDTWQLWKILNIVSLMLLGGSFFYPTLKSYLESISIL